MFLLTWLTEIVQSNRLKVSHYLQLPTYVAGVSSLPHAVANAVENAKITAQVHLHRTGGLIIHHSMLLVLLLATPIMPYSG